MRVIIAGSRSITDKDVVFSILDNLEFKVTSVVCGMAKGVDNLGMEWAKARKIYVDYHPALWDTEGVITAGIKRNERMANCADVLVLIWDGFSKGSRDMLKRAKEHNLKVDLYDLSQPRLF